jgi:hypothetical protein
MSTSDEIAEAVAYTQLRRLQSRYADIVTRRAWPELSEIMRADCVITVNLVDDEIHFHGPQEIGDFIGGQLQQFDFFEFVILNTVMDIDVAAGAASARMYMQEARQNLTDGVRSDTFGVYHDRFERDDDGWWFARRRYQSYARTNGGERAEGDADLTVFPLPEIALDELH